MSSIDKMAKELRKIITEPSKNSTSPFDSTAEVLRSDGNTLWVHIPGGAEETPVLKTIDAKAGDMVNVHIENGGGWIVGNASAPPTDDTYAKKAEAQAVRAATAANSAIASSNIAKQAADEAQRLVGELENDVDELNDRVTEAEGTVETLETSVESLGNRVATAEGNITTIEGDISSLDTRVDTAESDITTIEGNVSSLTTRVTTAEGTITTIEGDISSLDTRVDTAESDITTVEGNISSLQTRVAEAEDDIEAIDTLAQQAKADAQSASQAAATADAKAVSAGQAASAAAAAASEADSKAVAAGQAAATAETHAQTAITNAATAQSAAEQAISDAASAQSSAQAASTAASEAKTDAAAAHTAANNALTELSTVQDVVGTVEWAASHSGQDMADYINSHLALTTYGLDLVLDNTSYRIHIGTHTATGDEGVYIIDDEGNVVSFFGENIEFDSDHAQYIGNNNAYIVFDPTGNGGQGSLTIGGSSIQMGNRTLDDVLGKTLIYDHTYEYVRDSNNKPISANFTAFLYRGGVDVKTEYPTSYFTWYLKKEEKGTGVISETQIGTGYTCSVNLSDCGYGAEIIGKFTLVEDSNALTNNGNNLTNTNNTPLSVRASGDSVRVRDLSTTTAIFPTDKLMIIGAEDEHLVTIQTLEQYLNANLTKQVRFDTTANWNSQTTLVSEANTIYIYTDHGTSSEGYDIAGIKVGDGMAYVVDLPFIDEAVTEHIADSNIHVTPAEKAFWNNKVRCYLTGTEQLIFTTL